MKTAQQWREFIVMLGRPPNWIEESLMLGMGELERQIEELVNENRGLREQVQALRLFAVEGLIHETELLLSCINQMDEVDSKGATHE